MILPNNKNIRPVAEQVDALTDKTVRVVATGSIVEGFAALLAYDPAAGADTNVAAMAESAARVVPAEVTRAVRDSTTDAGEVREGDYIGISRDGVVAIADNVVVCTRLLLEPPARRLPRARDPHRGRRRPGGRHPAHRRMAVRGIPRRSRSRCTRAASLSTRTSSGLSSGRSLRDLSERPVSVLESVSERRAENLAKFGVESVLDLLTTYPRRYIDRTRQADVSDLVVGDEAAVLATVQSARSRRSKQGRAVVDVVVRDDTGRLAIVFFNQPWRAKQLEQGTEAIFFGKVGEYRGTRQMVNPVVDVVAGMSPGRRTLRILPVYPASAKSSLTSWEISNFVEEALEPRRGAARPVARGVARRAATCGDARRPSAPSTCPSRSTWCRRPGAGSSSTSSSGCSWPWSCVAGLSR